MFKDLETSIFIPTTRGENTRAVNLSAKGKSSQKAKHHYQLKREKTDLIHSNKVQKSLDKQNSILIAKKEVQILKQKSKSRRVIFAANRKAKSRI